MKQGKVGRPYLGAVHSLTVHLTARQKRLLIALAKKNYCSTSAIIRKMLDNEKSE